MAGIIQAPKKGGLAELGCFPMATTLFYDGAVPDAIQKSRRERKPLVVFLKGSDAESDRMEQILSSEASPLLVDCIVLKLDDDLANPDDAKYKNAKMFRQFFPTDTLPTMMVMGLNGPALTALTGSVESEKVLSEIKRAKDEFQSQVDALNHQEKAAVSTASTPPGEIPTPQPTASKPPPPATQKTPAPPHSEPKKPSDNAQAEGRSDPLESGGRGADLGRSGEASTSQCKEDAGASGFEDMESVEEVVVKKTPKKKAGRAPKPLPVYDVTTLQFRLTNGESIRAEFASDATLREVCGYLDLHRTDGFEPYVLETLYPRQKLGVDQHTKTLKELDLVPRSTVILTALNSSSQSGSVANAQNAGLGGIAGGVLGGVGKVISYVNPLNYFFGGGDRGAGEAQDANRSNAGNGGQSASGSGVQNIPKASEAPGVRRRPNWGSNVHGLRDENDSKGEDDPSKNKFWNGNSTQYGGHED
ncbi:hypothetical protein BSKO_08158 [Bryopsis sp. KO-2023]|nr:hypothetical protein BSKO_08158 [Bryopsis sp. KO-2023]